jgi:hypothetical protein
MTIIAKYGWPDTVWLMYNNQPIEGRVNFVEIIAKDTLIRIRYNLGSIPPFLGNFFHEDVLFPTKQDLISSL